MSARQPAHGRVKRSIADFALSLAVIFAMLALLVGVPYALALGFGRPFSGDGPSMLTRPMSIRILVGSLSVLLWLAWIQLVACVVVELWAGIRAVAPRRVPLSRAPQALARHLTRTMLYPFIAARPKTIVAPGAPMGGPELDRGRDDGQGDPESTLEFPAALRSRPGNVHQAMRNARKVVHDRGAGGWSADGDLPDLPDFVAAASLMAAGLLVALQRHRRVRLRTRAPGHRLPHAERDAAPAEKALLLGADPYGARLLDLGLRHLHRELTAQGRRPPTVNGAFLAPGHLDLWIQRADRAVPAPWTAVDDGNIWRLSAAEGHGLPEDPGTPAPYPGLVSLGTNNEGRVLVDLARGLVNVRGRPHLVAAALAAVATELATNRWSDDMRLVLVGFGAELALIAPDRVTAVPTLAEALAKPVGQAARGERVREATPTYLLSVIPPTPAEAARLCELAAGVAGAATGCLVAGDGVPGALWTWDLASDGRAGIGALGLEVQGQLLPEQQYGQIIRLFQANGKAEGVLLPQLGWNRTITAQLHPVFRPAAEVRLLGPIEVIAPGPIDDKYRLLCTELVCYLATSTDGVRRSALTSALWPRGVEASERDAVIARTRDWLGIDGRGAPNLLTEPDDRLSLGPEVRVDWQVLRELLRLAIHGADRGTPDTAEEADHLGHALSLVRGPFLQGRQTGRFTWLAGNPVPFEVAARVTDAAHRLTELRLAAGDAAAAVTAALAGLRLSDEDESLWRDLLRAARATGDDGVIQHWLSVLRDHAASRRFQGRLMPETAALLEEPSWPRRAAGAVASDDQNPPDQRRRSLADLA